MCDNTNIVNVLNKHTSEITEIQVNYGIVTCWVNNNNQILHVLFTKILPNNISRSNIKSLILLYSYNHIEFSTATLVT